MSGIQSYFKRLKPTNTESESQNEQASNSLSVPTVQEAHQPPQASQFHNIENLEADPGKRPSIYSMTSNPREREDIRRAYLLKGPTQPILKPFPQTKMFGKMRRFNPKWYEEFGS